MRPDLILWAVPLDAAEPNLIYEHGRALDPQADLLRCQEILARLSRLSATAKPLATGGRTEVKAARGQLLLTVPIRERDEMDRESPVTVLLPTQALRQPHAVDDVVSELVEVLGPKGRTVDEPDVRATLTNLAGRARRAQRPSSSSAPAVLRSLLELAVRLGPLVLQALVGAVIRLVRRLFGPASREQARTRAKERL